MGFGLRVRATANVKGPTRPKNISAITITLPTFDKSAVIPNENPTVAKAETTSNNNGKNSI